MANITETIYGPSGFIPARTSQRDLAAFHGEDVIAQLAYVADVVPDRESLYLSLVTIAAVNAARCGRRALRQSKLR